MGRAGVIDITNTVAMWHVVASRLERSPYNWLALLIRKSLACHRVTADSLAPVTIRFPAFAGARVRALSPVGEGDGAAAVAEAERVVTACRQGRGDDLARAVRREIFGANWALFATSHAAKREEPCSTN